jgi:hypothetical protein
MYSYLDVRKYAQNAKELVRFLVHVQYVMGLERLKLNAQIAKVKDISSIAVIIASEKVISNAHIRKCIVAV